MNYLQLCQKLRQEVGGSGNGPSTVLSQTGENRLYVDWINDAWIEIQNKREKWRFMWKQGSITLQPNTQVYSMPVDFKEFDDGSIFIDDRRVVPLHYDELRNRSLQPNQMSPRFFSLLPNGQLKIDTLPDQAYEMRFDYFQKAQSLSANTDIPSIPSEYHMLIVYLAMKAYGGYENAMEVYQRADTQYDEMLMSVERTELPELILAGPMV